MLSGGQPGNQNAAKAKRWQKALERALARFSGSTVDDGLDKIADNVVALAASNDKWAVDELANRIDGKPAQTISGDPEAPLHAITEIINRGVVPQNGS